MAQPPSPQMCILVCYPVAVESVVVFEWQLNFAHWDVGRIPVVVSEFAGVSFCFSIFGLPPGFQQHSTPAPAPATGHSQCIRSPLAGANTHYFEFGGVGWVVLGGCDISERYWLFSRRGSATTPGKQSVEKNCFHCMKASGGKTASNVTGCFQILVALPRLENSQ